MKLSFLVPVYNSEKCLKSCLDSILCQDNINKIEIILIDDASTDNSLNIMKEYQKKHENIKIVALEKNGGQSIARNIGIENATGDYIFFMDSDDNINKEFSKYVFEKTTKYPEADLIRIANVIVNKSESNLEEYTMYEFDNKDGKEALALMYKNGLWIETPWSYVIKRSYWNDNKYKFAENRFQEDLGIIPLIVVNAKNICSSFEAVYYYNIRENTTMTKDRYSHKYKLAYDVIAHYDFYKENLGLEDKQANNILFSIVIRALINRLNDLNKKDKKEYRKILKSKKIVRNIKIYKTRDLLKRIYYFAKLYVI